jgi:hypothetical protein
MATGSGQGWRTALDSIVDAATKGFTAYSTVRTAKDLSRINVQRAQAGLAPLDPSMYAPQVRITPDFTGIMPQRNTLLMVGAGVLALVLVMRLMRR